MKRLPGTIIMMLILVAADQFTKLLTLRYLKDAPPIVLIKGVLELTYVENRGAAFGMLQNRQWIFLIITVIVLIIIWKVFCRIPANNRYLPLRICCIVLGAGALGNMIDRVLRGYVVDFIYFRLIDFPVFNVADIYVTVTAFVLAALVFAFYKDEELDVIFRKQRK